MEQAFGIQHAVYRSESGPELAYRVVPAARYGFSYRYEPTDSGAEFGFTTDFSRHKDHRPDPIPVRGTVVMLHGWSMDGTSMLPWALALGERGYQSILVDLRSHGDSKQATVGYGPAEGADIARLAQQMEAEGKLQGTFAIFGISYGAVAGLQAATHLHGKVDGVIAMSPYSNAADGIRGMIDTAGHMGGNSLPSRLQRTWIRMRYDDEAIDRAINEASERIGTDLASLETADAIRNTSACIAILHGTNDEMFNIDTIRPLADASNNATFTELEGEGHISAPLRVDLLASPVADWLDALPAKKCPAFDPEFKANVP